MVADKRTEIEGRYVLHGCLASGGMATVHLGRRLGPIGFSRLVAIKRMRAELLADPSFVSMFEDEARVAGRISHPNVIPVVDVVSTRSELLLVMEYVRGESLNNLCRLVWKQNGVPPAVGAAIVRDVLQGLHAAHETKDDEGNSMGLVHRDVSPQNVLVGVDGVARVLDFGIAKAIGRSQVTRDGAIRGKLAYMAPEQLNGDACRASDIFSASIVLWEMLTKERLFLATTDPETIMRVLAAPIRRPSEVRPELGMAFDDVVMRGLERDVERRYATAREMAADLVRAAKLADSDEVGAWVSKIAWEALDDRVRLETETEVEVEVEVDGGLPSVRSARSADEQAPTRALEAASLAPVPDAPVSNPPRAARKVVYVGLLASTLVVAVALLARKPAPENAPVADVPKVADVPHEEPHDVSHEEMAASSIAALPTPTPAPSSSSSSLTAPTKPAGAPKPPAARAAKTSPPRIPDHL